MNNRYSLADYTLTVIFNDSSFVSAAGLSSNSISIGGEESYLNNFTISYANSSIWTTSADSTGSYVHNKNLQKNGSIQISINQMSEQVKQFIQICNVYFSSSNIHSGATIKVYANNGTDNVADLICTATSCFIQGIPPQGFAAQAQNQNWTFTCGKIVYE